MLLCDGDDLIDVLRGGQGVLNVLPLSGVRDEVDSNIISLQVDIPSTPTAKHIVNS